MLKTLPSGADDAKRTSSQSRVAPWNKKLWRELPRTFTTIDFVDIIIGIRLWAENKVPLGGKT